jgi:nucleoside-diphosphate-sugar epimerase
VRVLVLGGTGFIGSRVTRLLAQHDHEVTVVHRGTTSFEAPATVRQVLLPFAELSDRLERLTSLRPELVLDMVPYLDKQGHGILHFRGVVDRGVAVTSGDVYRAFGRLWRSEPGPPDPVPLTEDSPLREKPAPEHGDGYDNVDVEVAVAAERDLRATVLRLPPTHGPGDPQHRPAAYVKRMLDGRPAILIDSARASWRWSRGYVDNVAAAIVVAVEDERAAGRVYNVSSPRAESEAAWIRRIARVVGWEGEVVALAAEKLPVQLRTPHDYRQDFVLDSSRLRRELGYTEVIGEDEGLAATVAWERENLPGTLVVDYAAEDEALASAR